MGVRTISLGENVFIAQQQQATGWSWARMTGTIDNNLVSALGGSLGQTSEDAPWWQSSQSPKHFCKDHRDTLSKKQHGCWTQAKTP